MPGNPEGLLLTVLLRKLHSSPVMIALSLSMKSCTNGLVEGYINITLGAFRYGGTSAVQFDSVQNYVDEPLSVV
jgi:hypothetical protein